MTRSSSDPSAARQRCILPSLATAPPTARAAEHCPTSPTPPAELPTGRVTFLDAPAAPEVYVEHASTDEARSLGLMYRSHLASDHGMLFSWADEGVRSFWMRNTCIPLDMLFIAGDGTIVGILEQVPVMNTLPRSVPCPARHVLEVNAGWARRHGVRAGQRVRIDT